MHLDDVCNLLDEVGIGRGRKRFLPSSQRTRIIFETRRTRRHNSDRNHTVDVILVERSGLRISLLQWGEELDHTPPPICVSGLRLRHDLKLAGAGLRLAATY